MRDDQDFDAFYAESVRRVAGHVALLTGEREEARDCVQEAYERAWLRWRHVGQLQDPEAWVRTVARRLAVSRWRKARGAFGAGRRQQAGSGAGPDHAPGAADRVALLEALRSLPEVQRTAIVLHHLCDLDVARVAEETRSSVSAVKTRLARGRARLAVLLHDPRLTDDAAPAAADTAAPTALTALTRRSR